MEINASEKPPELTHLLTQRSPVSILFLERGVPNHAVGFSSANWVVVTSLL